MAKTTQKSDLPWSAIFSVIVCCTVRVKKMFQVSMTFYKTYIFPTIFDIEMKSFYSLHQAISVENFNQSEQVAVGTIFNLHFCHWREAFHCAIYCVNFSSMCSKQAFYFLNLSTVHFFIASQIRSDLHIFWQRPIIK